MADSKTTKTVAWSARLLVWGSRGAALLATRTVRFVVIGLFTLLTLYLLYGRVWQPLRAEVPLPPGVSQQNPELDTGLLQIINNQRVERVDQGAARFVVRGLFRPVER